MNAKSGIRIVDDFVSDLSVDTGSESGSSIHSFDMDEKITSPRTDNPDQNILY